MSWVAVGVGVAGLAVGAVGASMASGAAGDGRDLQTEGENTLATQIALAPKVYAAESSQAYGQPAYARLQRNVLYENLFGEPPPAKTTTTTGGTTTYNLNPSAVSAYGAQMGDSYGGTYGRDLYYGGPDANFGGLGFNLGDLSQQLTPEEFAALDPAQKQFYTQSTTGGTTTTTGGAPGILDLYKMIQPEATALEQAYQSSVRANDLADVQALGPVYKAAFDAANPEQAALRSELLNQAQSELALGSELTAEEKALADESIRSGYADRGRLYGTPAITAEVLNRYGLGEQRQASRRAFAQSALNIANQTQIDPSMAVLGRTSVAPNFASQASNQITGGGPTQFDPWSSYAADLYNTNYNAQVSANLTAAQGVMDLGGGMMSFAGGLYGG